MTILTRTRPLSRVVRQIIKRDNGVWLDASDMSTMFQNAAGTTPVTAMEQPVGLWLDKSGNGNHASQSITASRPVLSARYNLLTKTEDFAVGSDGWTHNCMLAYSNISVNPFGNELTADKLVPSTSGNSHFIYFNMFPFVSGISYTFSVYCASAGLRYIQLTLPSSAFGSSQYANFDLQTGTITQAIDCTASIEACQNGFYRLSITKTCLTTASGGGAIATIPDRSSGRLTSYFGDGVSGCYVWGADLRIGVAGPYQRVNTATDYDSVGWPKYLLFDGIDDALLYDSPYALGSNPSTHILAATPVQQISANRGFFTINPTSTASSTQRSLSVDTVTSIKADCRNAPAASFSTGTLAGVIRLFAASFGVSKKASIAVNGSAYIKPAMATTPNTTATNSVIGYGLTNLPLGFNLYGFISTGSDLSDTDRRRCEQFLASRLTSLGVTLS